MSGLKRKLADMPARWNPAGQVVILAVAAALFAACRNGGSATAAGHAARLERGRSLYASNGCRVCHGPDGRGDGPSAATLTPPPRDLHDPASFERGASVEDIATTLGAATSRETIQMPSFSHLPEADRLALAEFIVSLRTP